MSPKEYNTPEVEEAFHAVMDTITEQLVAHGMEIFHTDKDTTTAAAILAIRGGKDIVLYNTVNGNPKDYLRSLTELVYQLLALLPEKARTKWLWEITARIDNLDEENLDEEEENNHANS